MRPKARIIQCPQVDDDVLDLLSSGIAFVYLRPMLIQHLAPISATLLWLERAASSRNMDELRCFEQPVHTPGRRLALQGLAQPY